MKKAFPGETAQINQENAQDYAEKLISQRTLEANAALKQKIQDVAEKLRKGEDIMRDKDGNPDFDELRISRALGMAYLKTSGALEHKIEQAKQQAKEHELKQKGSAQAEHKETHPFAHMLALHGLSQDHFEGTALHASTPAYKSQKQASQGKDAQIS